MIRNFKKKIIGQLENAWDWIDESLRRLCGKPTPLKRLIAVLIIGGALSIGYVYMLASSIYNMGKRDAERDFLELQHIEQVKMENGELRMENGELKIKNREYEYEQSR